MNYKNYFPRLTKIETFLFENGYWKLGFVDWQDKERPIVSTTAKWNHMMDYLLGKYPKIMITEDMLWKILKHPNREVLIKNHQKQESSIRSAERYKSNKAADKK